MSQAASTGVFSPWGDLYLINGDGERPPDDVEILGIVVEGTHGGIRVFTPDPDGDSARLIADSQNGAEPFNYEYHPGGDTLGLGGTHEEPEGIDWWNLDGNTKVPAIEGQLHAIMLDNDGFAEDGDLSDDDDFYFKHYAVDYGCVVDQDSDGDGLTDRQEAYVHNTEPRLPDTDRDGLSDGLEVSTLGTDPLAADSDGDGVPDGDEDTDGDGLADGAEVNTHGTDPADADSDDDLLADGLEVAHGVDLRDPDSDDDGLPDGQDVEFIQNAVLALPTSDFRPPGRGTRNAMLSILDGAESKLLQGDVDGATKLLTNLRTQLDGCGGAPDNNDCADQTAIRGLLDQLLSNLES